MLHRKGHFLVVPSLPLSFAWRLGSNNHDERRGIRNGVRQNRVPFSVPKVFRYPARVRPARRHLGWAPVVIPIAVAVAAPELALTPLAQVRWIAARPARTSAVERRSCP